MLHPLLSAMLGVTPAPKLLDRLRDHLRSRHYSIRTQTVCVDWARRFILFHGKRHPQDMGGAEVEAFLTHLAGDRHILIRPITGPMRLFCVGTKQVFSRDLPWPGASKNPDSAPVVCHSFAARWLQACCGIRTVQKLLGHADVSTTMIYTHVLNKGGRGILSPLDAL